MADLTNFEESLNENIEMEVNAIEDSKSYDELMKAYAQANNKYNLQASDYNVAKAYYDELIALDDNAKIEPPVKLAEKPNSITYSGRDVQLSKLKNNIHPYAKETVLFETLKKMINEDGDYIRKFLINHSNIVFQKDFIIDDINKYGFVNTFNNDSTIPELYNDSIVLSFSDTELYSQNHSFIMDVFINGVKLSRKYYTDYPSTKTYNFKTGARRVFISKTMQIVNEDNEIEIRPLVKNGDTISVVVRRYKDIEKVFYQAIKIMDQNDKNYFFKDYVFGDFNNDKENLIVYKKEANENSFKLVPPSNYCFVIENKGIYLQILETALLGSTYLVMNKLYFCEITVENKTDLTLDEYLEETPTMRLDFVTKYEYEGCKIPVPVNATKEVEIYIDGLRLIPDEDFTLYNNTQNDENQFVSFNGILKPNSEIIMRNKNFGYSNYNSDTNSYYSELYRYEPSMDNLGLFDLSGLCLPVSLSYTEAYVGRRRVDNNHKRVIANSILKIDGQTCRTNIEIYFELNLVELVRELLSKYMENLPHLDSLYNHFREQVKTHWLDNNEERANSNINDANYTSDEVFLGKIYRIQLLAEPSVIYYGREPEFSVWGFYQGSDVGTNITDNPEVLIDDFDKYSIGTQRIYATYRGVQDSIVVNVINKAVVELKIVTSTNLYVVGDNIKNDIKVIAIYEDDSQKVVTDDDNCIIDCTSNIATEVGSVNIKVSYQNGEELTTASKYVLVSDEADRKIINIEYITEVETENNGNKVTFIPYIQYENTFIQKVDPSTAKLYLVEEDEILLNDFSFYNADLDSSVKLKLEVYTNNSFTAKYEYSDKEMECVEVPILDNAINNENRILYYDNNIIYISKDFNPSNNVKYYRVRNLDGIYITIGENNIGDESICFTEINNSDLVIVEFLDDSNTIISQLLFNVKNVNEVRPSINGFIYGSPYEGFTVKLSKILSGLSFNSVQNTSIYLTDKENNVIASLNPNDGFDMLSDESEFIYFHFLDFCTNTNSNGNVLSISEFFFNNKTEEDVLYLNILNCDYSIKLNRPDSEFNKVGYSKVQFFMPSNGEDVIELYPNFKTVPEGFKLTDIYEARPNSQDIFRWDNNADLPENVEFEIDSDFSVLVRSSLYGHNIFYFIFTDENNERIIYSFDVEIAVQNARVRIVSINNYEITDKKYDAFPVITSRD